MTTLTSGATTITPQLVDGYEASQQSGNVVHDIIGRPDPDVTLRPADTRAGTLKAMFLSASSAESARVALSTAAVWALNDAMGEIEMTFVLDGELGTALDPATRLRWILSIGFREVLP